MRAMANTSSITLVLYSLLAAALVSSASSRHIIKTTTDAVDHPPVIKTWLENLNPIERARITVLRFYMHDIVQGSNDQGQSVYNVTQPVIPDSPTWFGLIQVVDHRITSGRDYNSLQVGRVQGYHILSDMSVPAIAVTWNFFLNDGSTLSVLGRLESLAENGVLSIVGGTGDYAMARGVAVKRIVQRDDVTLNAIQEYTMYVYTSGVPGIMFVM